MKIVQHEITVRELAEGYKDNLEEGVKGYGGKLDSFTNHIPDLSLLCSLHNI